MQEWLSSIYNNPHRSAYGDEYSQYSYVFDLYGLKTLLDLGGLTPGQLFDEFGMPEVSAHRLLGYIQEDIRAIRVGGNTRLDSFSTTLPV